MQSAYEGLQAEAANFRQQLLGQLRIGIVPLTNIEPMLMLQHLSETFTEIRFQVSSGHSEKIIDDLNSNRLDIGICYLEKADTHQHDIYSLKKTKLGLLFNRTQFTPATPTVTWEMVATLPLALISQANYFRQSIDLAFQRYNLQPKIILESDSTLHLIQSVNSGFCSSIIPITKKMEKLSDNIDIIPIEDAVINASLGILIRREEPRSVLIETCFANMCDYVEKINI
nr:LysR family transcriptional regulator substrate-binding protein [Xenorhabdus sp. PB30.3]